jgi:hypothetical protein
MPIRSLLAAGLLVALPAGFAVGAPAVAADPQSDNATRVFHAQLDELNGSGASGTAKLRLKGTMLNIRIDATGLVPNLVHAQHIHGVGNSECPPPEAAGTDGILSTVDGVPFYGPVVTSLTTEGDTSPASGLNIEIMPVADANGEIHYRRTIELPTAIAADLEAFQIVQHGVDFNASGMYDFSSGPSELNPAFPQEATAPANCGTIEHNADGHSHSH